MSGTPAARRGRSPDLRRRIRGGVWDVAPTCGEGLAEGGKAAFLDRAAHAGHQRLVVPEVVQGAQDRGQHLVARSEEHTSELQSLMRISYAVFCLNKKKHHVA